MPMPPKTLYPVPDMWNVFGHSYCQFTGGSVDQTGRFDALFRASLDVEYSNWRNRAVAGAQLSLQGRKLGGFGRVLQESGKNTTRGAPYTADGGALLLCYGINDMGNNGTGPSTAAAQRNNFINTMRTVISFWRAARVFDDTDASISYAAGFASGAGTSDWSVGNSTRNAVAIGGTANFTITLPADYDGSPVVLCFDGASTNGGTVTFSGTAGVTGTFSTSGINNIFFNHSKCVKRITTLTSANAGQTIVVTTSQMDSGGSVSFDAWWIEAKAAPPIIVCNVARLTATGYGLYASWTGTEATKDAEVLQLNTDLIGLVSEFDAMVQVADLDSAMNKNVAYYWDGLHPNELGAARCADACLAAMKRFRPTTANGATVNFNTPSPRMGFMARPRRGGLYYRSDFATDGTAAAIAVGTQYWTPFIVTSGRERYVRMGIGVVAAGTGALGTIRWGIYDDVGWTSYPQNLITELTAAGAFSVPLAGSTLAQAPASGTGSLNLTLDPGLYWLSVKGITRDGGSVQTFRFNTGVSPFMPNTQADGSITLSTAGYVLTGQGTTALADTAVAGATVGQVPGLAMQLF